MVVCSKWPCINGLQELKGVPTRTKFESKGYERIELVLKETKHAEET